MSANHPHAEIPTGFRPRRANVSARSQFLKWLRKIHGWVGLWGAVIGLLFGVTGFLQNHRAVLKIPLPAPVRSTIQVEVPSTAPQNARDFADWLGRSLQLDNVHPRIMREPAQKVTWGGQEVTQPEKWEIRFAAPHYNVFATYWKGAGAVSVTRNDNGWLTVIENLHKATGVGIGWILFADSIAGAMALLSITGVILWSELNKRRVIGFSIFCASVIVMVVMAAKSM